MALPIAILTWVGVSFVSLDADTDDEDEDENQKYCRHNDQDQPQGNDGRLDFCETNNPTKYGIAWVPK